MNTLILNGSISVSAIKRMIDRSYALVIKNPKKVERFALALKHDEDTLYRLLRTDLA